MPYVAEVFDKKQFSLTVFSCPFRLLYAFDKKCLLHTAHKGRRIIVMMDDTYADRRALIGRAQYQRQTDIFFAIFKEVGGGGCVPLAAADDGKTGTSAAVLFLKHFIHSDSGRQNTGAGVGDF